MPSVPLCHQRCQCTMKCLSFASFFRILPSTHSSLNVHACLIMVIVSQCLLYFSFLGRPITSNLYRIYFTYKGVLYIYTHTYIYYIYISSFKVWYLKIFIIMHILQSYFETPLNPKGHLCAHLWLPFFLYHRSWQTVIRYLSYSSGQEFT